jgi:hypothetical protein
MIASPGGGEHARASLTPTLEVMGAQVVVSSAFVFTRRYVDATGNVTHPETVARLRAGLQALASSIAARPR